MSSRLTPKQKLVLDFIEAYSAENGYAPSQQEIAREFGFQSLGTVQNYLVRLEALGRLRRSWNGRRSLEVLRPDARSATEVPLVGRVAAGVPIEAVACAETLEVPSWMLGQGDSFALRVQGDSMVGDGILDGDYVVVKHRSQAESGSTVVALVDGEATVKRLRRTPKGFQLVAANPAYEPIDVRGTRDFRVLGVVVGVLRRCR